MAESKQGLTIGWSVFVQIGAWLVAGMVTYSALQARVSVIESRVDRMQSDLTEIKLDVKTLIRTVKP